MNAKTMKIETIESVPELATTYLMYGDESGLSAPDKREIDHWLDGLRRDGFRLVAPIDGTRNECCSYPPSDWLAPRRTGLPRTFPSKPQTQEETNHESERTYNLRQRRLRLRLRRGEAQSSESLDERPEEVSEQAVLDYIADETLIQYEAEKASLDRPLDGRMLCYGSLGLWWGRPTGCKIIDECNLNAVLDQACRDSSSYRVYFDGEDIRAEDGHHDGMNFYTFREIREDVGDDALDAFLDRLKSGKVSEADMERMTRSLAPYVCDIYGWTMQSKGGGAA